MAYPPTQYANTATQHTNYPPTPPNQNTTAADLEPQFTQFEAAPHPPIRPMAYASNMMGL